MLQAALAGAAVASVIGLAGCGRSPASERSSEPGSGGARHGLVGAGTLTATGVLLGIIDDPPRVELHATGGARSWKAPAAVGALASGARPDEVVVAAAWPEARLPRAEVWWLASGVVQRHCTWSAPADQRWRSQPRGASSLLAASDRAIVAGIDGSLIQFDGSCNATVLHGDRCCETERPLRLHGDTHAWLATDLAGQRAYVAGDARGAACVPVLDGTVVRGDGWTTALPAGLRDARMLDWSDACDTVLLAAGTTAWLCRATGCTRM